MATAGLELLYCSVGSQISSKQDALVCLLHWHMVTSELKCIGVGENHPGDLSACKPSEMLPNGWNSNQEVYTLLYVDKENTVFLLKCLKMNGILLVHVMRLSDEVVASMSLEVNNFVNDDLETHDSAFQNITQLKQIFKKEIQDVLQPAESSASAGSRQNKESGSRPKMGDDDPLRIPPRHTQRPPPPDWANPNDPFSLGRSDLDPFAGGRGGGMVMDPFHGGMPGFPGRIDPSAGLPQRLPRGAVPPGARFDPFGPPDPELPPTGHSGPDPDHLPPPGYDDMFM